MMTERQMLVWSALQLEPGKQVFDARIKTLIVRHDYDHVATVIQQFLAAIQSRKRVAGVLQYMEHGDDVVLSCEIDLFERAMMNQKAGFRGHVVAHVL